MELQRQFSDNYLRSLKDDCNNQDFIKPYLESNFVIDDNEDNVVKIPGLYNRHVDLKISDNPKDDFENAKLFFEAYKDMSPVVACQEAVWAYFTHVEYFNYVKQRWQITIETSRNSIIDHFFVNGMLKIARNGVARLWWPVYMSYDKENADPYHLTKILFSNTQAIFALSESQFFSCKPLTYGILEFFEEHENVSPTKVNIDKIIQYFNALGGVRELAFENKEFIKQTIDGSIQL